MEYDWRTRFGCSLDCIGLSMTITEAGRLAAGLMLDTSSHTCAAASGWDYPMSREALVLADLFDFYAEPKSRKPYKGYPRPWPKEESVRTGNAGTRSPADVAAILAAHGHDLTQP